MRRNRRRNTSRKIEKIRKKERKRVRRKERQTERKEREKRKGERKKRKEGKIVALCYAPHNHSILFHSILFHGHVSFPAIIEIRHWQGFHLSTFNFNLTLI